MVLFRREFSFVDSLYLWEVRANCYILILNIYFLFLFKVVSYVCQSIALALAHGVLRILMQVSKFSFNAGSYSKSNIDWFQLMWAMEYNPKSFSSFEGSNKADTGSCPKVDSKLLKQCGKFQKNYVKTGCTDHHSNAFAVFLVASVLETKNKQLLKEAKGLDDVVQVALFPDICLSTS